MSANKQATVKNPRRPYRKPLLRRLDPTDVVRKLLKLTNSGDVEAQRILTALVQIDQRAQKPIEPARAGVHRFNLRRGP